MQKLFKKDGIAQKAFSIKKMKKFWNLIKNIILWILSVFLILLGMGALSDSVISGFILVLIGLYANPVIIKHTVAIRQKVPGWAKAGCITVLVLFAFAFLGTNTPPETENSETLYSDSQMQTDGSDSSPTPVESEKVDLPADNSGKDDTVKTDDVNNVNNVNDVDDDGATAAPEEAAAASCLSVHFLDVGQGDCSLIQCDGEAMLVDAGNNSQGTKIQLYLKKQGVETLKYVVGTHPDADHIGGLDVILYKFPCETVIMPDVGNDTASYRDVIDTIDEKGLKITFPNRGDTYPLGGAEFTILGPGRTSDNTNDCSVAFLLKHGDNTFIFTGDAESEEESSFTNSELNLHANVYKVGHHGSASSSSSAFLEAVLPEYAVISCGMDNPYGHPHAETLNNLRSMGVSVFRTDEQGTVIAESDGEKLKWNCSPSDTWKAGEPVAHGDPDPSASDSFKEALQESETSKEREAPKENDVQDVTLDVLYILNTNTKKFHYPSCSSVSDMAEKNKRPSNEIREDIIARGYKPCKRCNP